MLLSALACLYLAVVEHSTTLNLADAPAMTHIGCLAQLVQRPHVRTGVLRRATRLELDYLTFMLFRYSLQVQNRE